MRTSESTDRTSATPVKRANPGNPRTPAYVRGKGGIVTALHGSSVNPLDHSGVYPPLCSVLFSVREVFGGISQDTFVGGPARELASARRDRRAEREAGWLS
jgi:hypothetical protein